MQIHFTVKGLNNCFSYLLKYSYHYYYYYSIIIVILII